MIPTFVHEYRVSSIEACCICQRNSFHCIGWPFSAGRRWGGTRLYSARMFLFARTTQHACMFVLTRAPMPLRCVYDVYVGVCVCPVPVIISWNSFGFSDRRKCMRVHVQRQLLQCVRVKPRHCHRGSSIVYPTELVLGLRKPCHLFIIWINTYFSLQANQNVTMWRCTGQLADTLWIPQSNSQLHRLLFYYWIWFVLLKPSTCERTRMWMKHNLHPAHVRMEDRRARPHVRLRLIFKRITSSFVDSSVESIE